VREAGHGVVREARRRDEGGDADMKNSLVGNINRRKKLGISRPKSKSTVSKKSYAAMKRGWKKSK
jgi:hypothetical protein